MARTEEVSRADGYYILEGNGRVFGYEFWLHFSNLPPASLGGFNPATAIFATAAGAGYWIADALGQVFPSGNAPNEGDMSGTHLNGPIIAASGS